MSGVDWAATGAMLQGIGTVGGAAAVVGAAILGASTFSSWKAQKIAERKLLQAEAILTAAYRVRRGLDYVRGPMMWAHELTAAEEVLKSQEGWELQSEGRRKRLLSVQGYLTRINKVQDDRQALEQSLPMARALFGEDLEQAMEALNRQFWNVQTYAEAWVDAGDADPEFNVKIRNALFGGTSKGPNEITDATKVAVDTIERICLPFLRLEAG